MDELLKSNGIFLNETHAILLSFCLKFYETIYKENLTLLLSFSVIAYWVICLIFPHLIITNYILYFLLNFYSIYHIHLKYNIHLKYYQKITNDLEFDLLISLWITIVIFIYRFKFLKNIVVDNKLVNEKVDSKKDGITIDYDDECSSDCCNYDSSDDSSFEEEILKNNLKYLNTINLKEDIELLNSSIFGLKTEISKYIDAVNIKNKSLEKTNDCINYLLLKEKYDNLIVENNNFKKHILFRDNIIEKQNNYLDNNENFIKDILHDNELLKNFIKQINNANENNLQNNIDNENELQNDIANKNNLQNNIDNKNELLNDIAIENELLDNIVYKNELLNDDANENELLNDDANENEISNDNVDENELLDNIVYKNELLNNFDNENELHNSMIENIKTLLFDYFLKCDNENPELIKNANYNIERTLSLIKTNEEEYAIKRLAIILSNNCDFLSPIIKDYNEDDNENKEDDIISDKTKYLAYQIINIIKSNYHNKK